MMWFAYAMVWLSTAGAVCYGMYITQDWRLLFFMLLPALVNLEQKGHEKNDL